MITCTPYGDVQSHDPGKKSPSLSGLSTSTHPPSSGIGAAYAGRVANRHRASTPPSKPLRNEVIPLPALLKTTLVLGVANHAPCAGRSGIVEIKDFSLSTVFCHP